MHDIREITIHVRSKGCHVELYDLIFDSDDLISYQTLWIFTHLSTKDNEWLSDKLDELIDEAMTCQHHGKRRLLLTLIYRQPLDKVSRVDFLDFCLERMLSKQELPAVHSICIKIAYELCLPYPELMDELRTILDIMQPELLVPSTISARKKVLKAMKTGK